GIGIRGVLDQHRALRQVAQLRKVLQRLQVLVVDPVTGPDHILAAAPDIPSQTCARAEILPGAALAGVAQVWNRDRRAVEDQGTWIQLVVDRANQPASKDSQ